MEIAVADEVQWEERKYPTRPGLTRTQPLLSCEGEDGMAFRVIRSRYQGGGNAFQTPRHHHTFQQIRFAEEGSLNYAPDQDIPEGDIAYFPRATYYGPQKRDHGMGLTVQFGFDTEMLGGKNALQWYRDGVEKLRTLGKVDNGVFIDTDPETGRERVRDSWQAVAEETTGRKFTFPDQRYATPILMHTAAYAFYPLSPGVEMKRLGVFNDHTGLNGDLRLSVVRLNEDGPFTLGSDRAQLLWTTSDGLIIGDRAYPAVTCAYSPRGEMVELRAEGETEFHLVELPRLD